jgi:3-oxoadipate enol-lactonase
VARTRYATSGRLRIAYEVRGGWRRRRPWLVFVQGLGYDRTGWAPVLRGLRRRFRLLLIDNRGSGRSDRSPGRFAVADMARDVAAVVRAAGAAPANLVGVSLGGMIAQEVAIEHPDCVDALILAATTPGWPSGYPMPARTLSLLVATARMPEEVAVRRYVENALSAATLRQRPELVEELIEHRRRRPTDQRVWLAQVNAGAAYAGNLRQSRIRARTLVLHGDADSVVDPRNAKLLAERIPDARLVILPGLGHLFFWEDPDAFVRPVLDFLLAGR